jgi:hypothetical protein
MSHIARLAPPAARSAQRPSSPLMLADRLIALAEDADRAGLRAAAERLVTLAHDVLERAPALLPA